MEKECDDFNAVQEVCETEGGCTAIVFGVAVGADGEGVLDARFVA
jgi:hypothetical protein